MYLYTVESMHFSDTDDFLCHFKHRYSSGKQHCDAESCDYLFTYSVEDYTNVTVELSGKSDWVGVGFSSDREMVSP